MHHHLNSETPPTILFKYEKTDTLRSSNAQKWSPKRLPMATETKPNTLLFLLMHQTASSERFAQKHWGKPVF